MEWWILQRWRQSAPNTPDWLAFFRVFKEACKPDPELEAMSTKLKEDSKRMDAQIAGFEEDLDNLRVKMKDLEKRFSK